MHPGAADAHGSLIATVAAVSALLRTTERSDRLRQEFDALASLFEARVQRMAIELPEPLAMAYLGSFVSTLQELRGLIPTH